MDTLRSISTVVGIAFGAAGCAEVADSATGPEASAELRSAAGTSAGLDIADRVYVVANLTSPGGTSNAGNSINDLAWVSGFANRPDDQSMRATLWLFGLRIDLGTLGGPNSAVLWPVKNNRGLITGVAETGSDDPLGESWSCSNFFPTVTGKTCLGFAWERGVMRALPTLGGNNGFATGANNRRQVVGWAENTVHDPSCTAPQVLQFRAVVWSAAGQVLAQLPPLPGDSTSAATAINDRGQVVGISGICGSAVGRFSAAHPVMWENGTVTDLGDLGGEAWNTAMAINQRGDVVGFANVTAGRAFNAHGFLWTREGGIQELAPLPGDVYSQGLGINERRQVVGTSCTAGFASCRAFVWQDGVMTDLNTLLTPGYGDHLTTANDIDDLGMITGVTLDAATGKTEAFLAIPFPRHHRAAAPARDVTMREPGRSEVLRGLGLGDAELAP